MWQLRRTPNIQQIKKKKSPINNSCSHLAAFRLVTILKEPDLLNKKNQICHLSHRHDDTPQASRDLPPHIDTFRVKIERSLFFFLQDRTELDPKILKNISLQLMMVLRPLINPENTASSVVTHQKAK